VGLVSLFTAVTRLFKGWPLLRVQHKNFSKLFVAFFVGVQPKLQLNLYTLMFKILFIDFPFFSS